jgi:hypothetical protein
MRRRRHPPIPEQGKWSRQIVAGYFEYHAVPTNTRALMRFRHHVTNFGGVRTNRSQKARITWNRTSKSFQITLFPNLHPSSWRHARFAVKRPRCICWGRSERCGGRLAMGLFTATQCYRLRKSSVDEALNKIYPAGVSVRRVEDINEAF